MYTVIKIAWRNIFRNKLRSFVVIGSIAVGVWALVFLISFLSGMIQTFVDSSVKNQTSHIQLHNPEFLEEREIKFTILQPDSVLNQLKKQDYIQAASLRTLCNAMLSTSRGTRGVMVRGVDPEGERKLTYLQDNIVEGQYFDSLKRNQIIMGRNLAQRLGLSEKKKVVLTFQDKNGDITSAAFRIAGMYSTGNSKIDDLQVYVNRKDLNRLMGEDDMAHELALLVGNFKEVQQNKEKIQTLYPSLLVRTYKEISVDLELLENQIFISSALLIAIFMLALIFGIINTMLMAVLERVKEIGVLMAIGMKKQSVFRMIVWETLFLGLVSAPLGLLLGLITIYFLRDRGIDLSSYGRGLEEFGLSTVVYPNYEPGIYLIMTLGVFLTALLGSIYPARKSIQLRPVEAIRKL
jgi:ABC-type lipoprotein release transport system permease subunit